MSHVRGHHLPLYSPWSPQLFQMCYKINPRKPNWNRTCKRGRIEKGPKKSFSKEKKTRRRNNNSGKNFEQPEIISLWNLTFAVLWSFAACFFWLRNYLQLQTQRLFVTSPRIFLYVMTTVRQTCNTMSMKDPLNSPNELPLITRLFR